MIIKAEQFRERIKSLWPECFFSPAPRAPLVFAFQRDFIGNKFKKHWKRYLKARGIKYIARSGMCEHFAAGFWVETNASVLEWAKTQPETERNVCSSAIECHVVLVDSLNNVPPSSHKTNIVAIANEDNFDLYFLEPQNMLWTKVDANLTVGIHLISVYD